jgi:molybdopterin-guanine dinucleotide biosynthesis protein A
MRNFDAIVLAGASARRLDGADKPMIEVGGRPMISHVLDAVRAAGVTVVVGPHRAGIGGVRWCEERPPGGGPVAALACAMALIDSDLVVVLAADLPDIAPAVPALLDAIAEAHAAVIRAGGRLNYLAAAWRTDALRARLAGLDTRTGASMRALMADLDLVEVIDPDGWSSDCDTWADVERARTRRRG